MTPDEIALEITRLKIRCEIHEALLAKLTLGMWLVIPGTSTQAAREAVLSVYEAIAEGLGPTLFGSEGLSSQGNAATALYRQELREIVDHMKSYVDLLTKNTP